ncbi:MAG: putative transposase [Parcubacteria group bacterium Athens1014_10]|nr:MAG: putative transposase [Parcubacteria group bacterium Athens1014_10]TSD05466.1 MAG: putative transposase [Parcubacteria group bacterium Athens0714_12]
MKKPIFAKDQIYHIYNRGVEKRNIFLDSQDYFRFIHNLFEFNDENHSFNFNHYFNSQTMEVEPQYLKKQKKPRELLVEILIFTLMPNHFHLLVRQKRENGIVKFMQKLGTGYAMYFNQKHNRVGGLFQGRFKAVIIKEDAHFAHLPYYIHANPLKLIMPDWKTEGVKDYKKAIKFLENYRWSSFLDYTGKKNFPSVTQREFFLDIFEGCENYKEQTKKWLKEMSLKK